MATPGGPKTVPTKTASMSPALTPGRRQASPIASQAASRPAGRRSVRSATSPRPTHRRAGSQPAPFRLHEHVVAVTGTTTVPTRRTRLPTGSTRDSVTWGGCGVRRRGRRWPRANGGFQWPTGRCTTVPAHTVPPGPNDAASSAVVEQTGTTATAVPRRDRRRRSATRPRDVDDAGSRVGHRQPARAPGPALRDRCGHGVRPATRSCRGFEVHVGAGGVGQQLLEQPHLGDIAAMRAPAAKRDYPIPGRRRCELLKKLLSTPPAPTCTSRPDMNRVAGPDTVTAPISEAPGRGGPRRLAVADPRPASSTVSWPGGAAAPAVTPCTAVAVVPGLLDDGAGSGVVRAGRHRVAGTVGIARRPLEAAVRPGHRRPRRRTPHPRHVTESGCSRSAAASACGHRGRCR